MASGTVSQPQEWLFDPLMKRSGGSMRPNHAEAWAGHGSNFEVLEARER